MHGRATLNERLLRDDFYYFPPISLPNHQPGTSADLPRSRLPRMNCRDEQGNHASVKRGEYQKAKLARKSLFDKLALVKLPPRQHDELITPGRGPNQTR